MYRQGELCFANFDKKLFFLTKLSKKHSFLNKKGGISNEKPEAGSESGSGVRHGDEPDDRWHQREELH